MSKMTLCRSEEKKHILNKLKDGVSFDNIMKDNEEFIRKYPRFICEYYLDKNSYRKIPENICEIMYKIGLSDTVKFREYYNIFLRKKFTMSKDMYQKCLKMIYNKLIKLKDPLSLQIDSCNELLDYLMNQFYSSEKLSLQDFIENKTIYDSFSRKIFFQYIKKQDINKFIELNLDNIQKNKRDIIESLKYVSNNNLRNKLVKMHNKSYDHSVMYNRHKYYDAFPEKRISLKDMDILFIDVIDNLGLKKDSRQAEDIHDIFCEWYRENKFEYVDSDFDEY